MSTSTRESESAAPAATPTPSRPQAKKTGHHRSKNANVTQSTLAILWDERVAATHPAGMGTTGGRHTAEELERSLHEAFELPSEFPVEEVAALLNFLLHRGAFLRLSRKRFAVDANEDTLWVYSKAPASKGAAQPAQGHETEAPNPH